MPFDQTMFELPKERQEETAPRYPIPDWFLGTGARAHHCVHQSEPVRWSYGATCLCTESSGLPSMKRRLVAQISRTYVWPPGEP